MPIIQDVVGHLVVIFLTFGGGYFLILLCVFSVSARIKRAKRAAYIRRVNYNALHPWIERH